MRKTVLCLAAALLTGIVPAAAAGGEKGDWELGLYAGGGFPDDYQNSSPGDLNPKTGVLYGGRVGRWLTDRSSLELSLQRLATETDFDSSLGIPDSDVNMDAIRLNYLWNLRPGERVRPFLTLGFGDEIIDVKDGDHNGDLGWNAGLGLRAGVTERFGVRFEARYISIDLGSVVDDRQNNLEATVGGFWAFGGKPPADSDGDGVLDRKDKCPDTPHGATVDAQGCPADGDGDGVFDGIDQCPDTPKGTPVDEKGCTKDTDGDGVHDGLDRCPKTPRGTKVDAQGCPLDVDGDGDGVNDDVDQCPNTPRGTKVDARGCPLDSDGDGVPDGTDQCPDTPRGTKVDARGCALQLFQAEKKTLVLEGVNFEVDKAVLMPESMAVLDRIAASLHDWPEVKVEIGGHTDATGSDAHNLKLSDARAQTVLDYLVAKGVDGSRLSEEGYGKSKPIADNKTSAGRAQNRRVELTRLN